MLMLFHDYHAKESVITAKMSRSELTSSRDGLKRDELNGQDIGPILEEGENI
jgi:hypothetical protein